MATRRITLEAYRGPWPPDDPDANFKAEVALCSLVDPMPTLDRMSRNLNIPVGCLARYVLSRWAASGSEGIMELGPRVVRQMAEIVGRAESAGTDQVRLEAYHSLARIIPWLAVPLTDPDWRPGGWPDGGD